jgi:hypothetical protein
MAPLSAFEPCRRRLHAPALSHALYPVGKVTGSPRRRTVVSSARVGQKRLCYVMLCSPRLRTERGIDTHKEPKKTSHSLTPPSTVLQVLQVFLPVPSTRVGWCRRTRLSLLSPNGALIQVRSQNRPPSGDTHGRRPVRRAADSTDPGTDGVCVGGHAVPAVRSSRATANDLAAQADASSSI